MVQLQWGTSEKLRALLCELVSWQSRSKTEGEVQFVYRLKEKLLDIPYFKQHPDQIAFHDAGLNRNAVTALYKHSETSDTIVLISHFDTVNTEEYGSLEKLAFSPEELTKELQKHKEELPPDALKDLESGDYLFGRGTMDMKTGLAVHMSIIEKASAEKWPINLVLLTVPDEEVDSAGMRAAVPGLVRLQEEHQLTYKLFLNGEPSFSQRNDDPNYYIYSGSIGKIMPSALIYGKETHVGEPMSGLTANYIASFLTSEMEFNAEFRESVYEESTPLPVSLRQRDIMNMEYSVQTPYRAQIMYNVFLMKRTASDVMEIFKHTAEKASNACTKAYHEICKREGVQPVGDIKVIYYEELHKYAENKLSKTTAASLIDEVLQNSSWDDREKSLRIADVLMRNCQELGPAIVLLFAPPYYPAVNSSDDPLVIELTELTKKAAQIKFGVELKQIHYYNGISDLSYVNYQGSSDGWNVYKQNTPVWGSSYSIPFEDMEKLKAPVFNLGPFGKDAHKRTERLHIESAFVQLPYLVENLIKNMNSVKKIEV
ncbi:M20/M25/M40 family metallo-hydrolase [Ureibacillus sp. NPDC094379]